jgi:hypothetical protein
LSGVDIGESPMPPQQVPIYDPSQQWHHAVPHAVE